MIKDDTRKQIYLQILSDQFCMGIVSSIIVRPKTAVEIAKVTNIPISTVYRSRISKAEISIKKPEPTLSLSAN